MKRAILVLVATLFLVGCGGGSSQVDKSFEELAIEELVEGKEFYEEDVCQDPKFRSYLIQDSVLEIKSYSDSNYSELVEILSYSILSFKDDEMKIKKDGDLLTCTVGYEVTDKREVTMLELDCVDANDTESTNTLFFISFDSKESAHKNRNECQ